MFLVLKRLLELTWLRILRAKPVAANPKPLELADFKSDVQGHGWRPPPAGWHTDPDASFPAGESPGWGFVKSAGGGCRLRCAVPVPKAFASFSRTLFKPFFKLSCPTAGRAWKTPFGDYRPDGAGPGVAHAVVLQLPLEGPLRRGGLSAVITRPPVNPKPYRRGLIPPQDPESSSKGLRRPGAGCGLRDTGAPLSPLGSAPAHPIRGW